VPQPPDDWAPRFAAVGLVPDPVPLGMSGHPVHGTPTLSASPKDFMLRQGGPHNCAYDPWLPPWSRRRPTRVQAPRAFLPESGEIADHAIARDRGAPMEFVPYVSRRAKPVTDPDQPEDRPRQAEQRPIFRLEATDRDENGHRDTDREPEEEDDAQSLRRADGSASCRTEEDGEEVGYHECPGNDLGPRWQELDHPRQAEKYERSNDP
jgi:hypothetical protein